MADVFEVLVGLATERAEREVREEVRRFVTRAASGAVRGVAREGARYAGREGVRALDASLGLLEGVAALVGVDGRAERGVR